MHTMPTLLTMSNGLPDTSGTSLDAMSFGGLPVASDRQRATGEALDSGETPAFQQVFDARMATLAHTHAPTPTTTLEPLQAPKATSVSDDSRAIQSDAAALLPAILPMARSVNMAQNTFPLRDVASSNTDAAPTTVTTMGPTPSSTPRTPDRTGLDVGTPRIMAPADKTSPSSLTTVATAPTSTPRINSPSTVETPSGPSGADSPASHTRAEPTPLTADEVPSSPVATSAESQAFDTQAKQQPTDTLSFNLLEPSAPEATASQQAAMAASRTTTPPIFDPSQAQPSTPQADAIHPAQAAKIAPSERLLQNPALRLAPSTHTEPQTQEVALQDANSVQAAQPQTVAFAMANPLERPQPAPPSPQRLPKATTPSPSELQPLALHAPAAPHTSTPPATGMAALTSTQLPESSLLNPASSTPPQPPTRQPADPSPHLQTASTGAFASLANAAPEHLDRIQIESVRPAITTPAALPTGTSPDSIKPEAIESKLTQTPAALAIQMELLEQKQPSAPVTPTPTLIALDTPPTPLLNPQTLPQALPKPSQTPRTVTPSEAPEHTTIEGTTHRPIADHAKTPPLPIEPLSEASTGAATPSGPMVPVVSDGTAEPMLEAPPLIHTGSPETTPTQPRAITDGTRVMADTAINPIHSHGVTEASNQTAPLGQSSITLQLRPEELGSVRMQLTRGANQQVHARLIVQHPEAQQALQRDISQLHQTLHQQGVSLDNVQIVLAASESQGHQTGHQPGHQPGSSAFSFGNELAHQALGNGGSSTQPDSEQSSGQAFTGFSNGMAFGADTTGRQPSHFQQPQQTVRDISPHTEGISTPALEATSTTTSTSHSNGRVSILA